MVYKFREVSNKRVKRKACGPAMWLCVAPLLSVVWQQVLAFTFIMPLPSPLLPIWWGPLWVKTGDPIETREERSPLVVIALIQSPNFLTFKEPRNRFR